MMKEYKNKIIFLVLILINLMLSGCEFCGNKNQQYVEYQIFLKYLRNENLQELERLLTINSEDVKLKMGIDPYQKKGDSTIFVLKVTNTSKRKLFIFDLNLHQLGDQYLLDGRKWVDLNLEMNLGNINSLIILDPGKSIKKEIILRDVIPQAVNINIDFYVPEKIRILNNRIMIVKAKVLAIFKLI